LNSHEPEAYQIGHVPFLGVTVYLDSHPLIPRTETEWWVEQVVKSTELKVAREIRVLDLFSGSGCVGLAILKHIPGSHVTFGEFTAKHLPTIEKNIRENGFDPRRAEVVQTDVWSAVPGMFDLILANPPYLSRARLDRIEASVLDHEPVEALFAEDDGFALIDATIQGLPTHLAPGGAAWIEHEPEHSARISALCGKLHLPATTHQDQYGVERYSVILKP
jgi:release factor glutamine methyltransferase